MDTPFALLATQDGCTPTYAAAAHGKAEVLKALIVANADVNAADKVKQMQVLALRLIAEHVEDTKALVLRPIQKKKVKLNFLYRPACVCVCVCVCIYMYYIIICIYSNTYANTYIYGYRWHIYIYVYLEI